MRWDAFERACPEIAMLARTRFVQDELVMLGTIRVSVDVASAGFIRFGEDPVAMTWDPERGLRRPPHPG